MKLLAGAHLINQTNKHCTWKKMKSKTKKKKLSSQQTLTKCFINKIK